MGVSTDPKKIKELLTRGVDEVIDKKSLEKKLKSGTQLRVKLGIDPTSPNIHLGRSIPLLKLRDFQELGHKIVFIIGDFTGVIGDTSDKDSERPMLEKKTIATNMKAYAAQAGNIIDIDKCEVRHNSEWLGKLTYNDVGEHADAFSVHEFISREVIKRRLDEGKRVSLREVLYPLMQGYDSVAIKADVELGGTDQRFNLLAGRKLQEVFDQAPQDILMNPLIEGTDGRKMSSSWGNVINVTDAPEDMYGKAMSIADELIIKYFTFLTRAPLKDIANHEKALKDGANPRDTKMALAFEITKFYHGEVGAQKGADHFASVIQGKDKPAQMDTVDAAGKDILAVLVDAGFAKSNSEARRAVDGGGVKINDTKVAAYDATVKTGDVVQKGKRFFVKIA